MIIGIYVGCSGSSIIFATYSLFLKEMQECSSNWKTEINIWHKRSCWCTSMFAQELEISPNVGMNLLH